MPIMRNVAGLCLASPTPDGGPGLAPRRWLRWPSRPAISGVTTRPMADPDGPRVRQIGCSGACHGQGDSIAPPRDTAGRSDLTSIGVGAHQAHLQGSTWHKRFTCETCHKVPAGGRRPRPHLRRRRATAAVQDPLPAELEFTGLGTARRGITTPRPARTATATATRSTRSIRPPTRSSSAPAARSRSRCGRPSTARQSACGTCHGNPPPVAAPAADRLRPVSPVDEPRRLRRGQDLVPRAPHRRQGRGRRRRSPCDSCHGGGGQSAPPKDAHGNTATTAPGVGAHAAAHDDDVDVARRDRVQRVPPGPRQHDRSDPPRLDQRGLPRSDADRARRAAGHRRPAADPRRLVQRRGADVHEHVLPRRWQQPAQGRHRDHAEVDRRSTGRRSQCTSCHGNPPPLPHPRTATAASCHPTMTAGNNTTITYPAKHIDGNVDVINDQPCDCGVPRLGRAIAAPPNDTTGGMTTNLRSVGAHRSHVGTASTWHAPDDLRPVSQGADVDHLDRPHRLGAAGRDHVRQPRGQHDLVERLDLQQRVLPWRDAEERRPGPRAAPRPSRCGPSSTARRASAARATARRRRHRTRPTATAASATTR